MPVFTKCSDSGNASKPRWDEVVDRAISGAQTRGARVLVVDTFAQFAGLVGEKENVAGDILAAMMPLQRARDAGLAVLLTRHERKEGGTVGESGRGNSALTGAVDIVLRLKRAEGQGAANRRQLEALSRFDETPKEVTLELNEHEYELVGQNGERGADITAATLLMAIPSTESEAVTTKELQGERFKRTSIQKVLAQLEENGRIQTTGAGKRNDPIRYFRLVPELPAHSNESGTNHSAI
jgi:hypothetical protein